MGEVKLTKAQRELLAKIYDSGGQIARSAMSRGEVMASKPLDFNGLIAQYHFANGRFWLITDAGRAALSDSQGERG